MPVSPELYQQELTSRWSPSSSDVSDRSSTDGVLNGIGSGAVQGPVSGIVDGVLDGGPNGIAVFHSVATNDDRTIATNATIGVPPPQNVVPLSGDFDEYMNAIADLDADDDVMRGLVATRAGLQSPAVVGLNRSVDEEVNSTADADDDGMIEVDAIVAAPRPPAAVEPAAEPVVQGDSTDLSSDAYDLAKENTSLHSGLMHLSAQGQNEHQSWTNENIESFSAVGGCLFFGNLASHRNDQTLLHALQIVLLRFGEVFLRIVRNRHGVPAAFARFKDIEEARSAFHELNEHMHLGRPLRVEFAGAERFIYVVCADESPLEYKVPIANALLDILAIFGPVRYIGAAKRETYERNGRPVGLFFEFQTRDDCRSALERLNGEAGGEVRFELVKDASYHYMFKPDNSLDLTFHNVPHEAMPPSACAPNVPQVILAQGPAFFPGGVFLAHPDQQGEFSPDGYGPLELDEVLDMRYSAYCIRVETMSNSIIPSHLRNIFIRHGSIMDIVVCWFHGRESPTGLIWYYHEQSALQAVNDAANDSLVIRDRVTGHYCPAEVSYIGDAHVALPLSPPWVTNPLEKESTKWPGNEYFGGDSCDAYGFAGACPGGIPTAVDNGRESMDGELWFPPVKYYTPMLAGRALGVFRHEVVLPLLSS